MANKRNGANSPKYKTTKVTTSVPEEAPVFGEEIDNNAEQNEVSQEVLNEIQTLMAEGAYNKGEEEEIEEIEDEEEKVFVTNDIPLANKEKKEVFGSLKEKSKKEEKVLSQKALDRKAKKEAKKAAYRKTTLQHKIKNDRNRM